MSQDARRNAETATQHRARLLSLNYLDTTTIANKQLFADVLTLQELYGLRVIPLDHRKGYLLFGITTTTSQQTISALRKRFTDERLDFVLISDAGFNEYMHLYDPPKKITYQDIAIAEAEDQNLVATISQTLDQVRADDILAYLVKQAYRLKASDIHLENEQQDIRIRFRVDGVLHPVAKLAKEKYHHVLSSIAVAANIGVDAQTAQTGHINRSYRLATGEDVVVNLRVETVPAAYGQDAVMRLFNIRLDLLKLENLGLSQRERKVVDNVIRHPTGMVLMVGPTGSGKTTTMYSLINTLNSPERKVITLEDPVEYFMPGIVQIPINSEQRKSGFAEMLRAVLRLDPDIVMLGEIRDQDTARTALQAALTGHLVMSTFHAGSAAAALTRMLDFIGVNPLFASAMRLIMAQRLVRRLDDATKQPYQPDDNLKHQLQQVLSTLPEGTLRPDLNNLTFYKPGSSTDHPFGFTGQLAIREQLMMTSGIQQLLRLPPNQVTTEALQQKAVEDGMLTMLQDGVLKACAGITTIEEVYRVVS